MFYLGNGNPLKNFKQRNGVIIFLVKKITRSNMENESRGNKIGEQDTLCNNL